jgi:hypothetical protein
MGDGVAAVSGMPANVRLTATTDPVTGPLTSGVGGAPRGIRTPNRQIRSLVIYVGLVGSRWTWPGPRHRALTRERAQPPRPPRRAR